MAKRTLILLSLTILTTIVSQATTTFKSTSVLSSGKWVKIKVGETGVYEITEQQLRDFGFSDPSAVKVFGQGGICPTENFTTVITDDLEQVAALHENGKIYFYAKGLAYEKTTLKDYSGFTLYKTITTNPYSADCYYFLTDREDIEALELQQVATADSDLSKPSEWYGTGVATVWHKKDLVNPTRSGKLFLGEDLSSSCEFSIDFSTPGIISGSTVMVNTSTAAKCDSNTLTVTANGNEIASKAMTATTDATIYKLYNLTGSTSVTETNAADEKTSVGISIASPAPIARIDYISASYTAPLALPADSSQMRYMVKMAPSGSTGLQFSDANTSTKMWLVGHPGENVCIASSPTDYPLLFNSEGIASVVLAPTSEPYVEFAMFDTAKEQKHITFAGNVANQNLHALDAPDMVIITTAKLMEQAERLAEYHRSVDGLDVLVVDHNDIYNEFGYGMRSAMAYRQLNRMLYERNPQKLRYLLLFGGGSYDNRCIFGGDPNDMLVVYESDASNHTVTSYTTDDFFSVMSDFAQTVEHSSAYQAFATGRIPFVSVSDAKVYVDKLIKYMSHRNDNNDTWKSNMLVIGENGDDFIHTKQTESFITNFNNEISSSTVTPTDYAVNFNKIYIGAFDEIDNLNGSREKFVEDLNAGQNFVLFIGHSNPTSTTKSVNFLNLQQAVDSKYEAIPMMYFSSCDIGRFDGGITTVLDKLMLNPDGGVIAAISATREAYTSINGLMTDAFAKFLGISETDTRYYGVYEKTWGRVLMQAKNNTEDRSRNRLKYQLFGDPALLVDVPHNRTHIATINDIDAEEAVSVGTMKPFTITGYVANAKGNIDTAFNGYAKLTLFDSEQFYMKQKDDELTQRGAELATTSAKVVNGEFTATLIVPNCIISDTNAKPLQTTAVSDSGTVVSGFYNGLSIDRSMSAESDDTAAPVIAEFYLGDKASFRDGMTVDSTVLVHAAISDNVALSTSSEQIATTAYLSLDGGDHIYALTGITLDGQDKCTVVQPIYNLTTGRHTLQLTVADISGNVSTRTIAFFVEGNSGATLSASASAVTDDVTFDLDNADTTDGTIVVSSADGSVKMRSEVSFPYTWNGCDNNGNRLDEGVYTVSAIIAGKSLPSKKIVVVKQ